MLVLLLYYSVVASMLRISPSSHSARMVNGRQQTSQSVVNSWLAMVVSNSTSQFWPQYGHWTVADSCIKSLVPV